MEMLHHTFQSNSRLHTMISRFRPPVRPKGKVKTSFIYIAPQLPHMPPQPRCCHRQGGHTSCSPSPRSRTLTCNHIAGTIARFFRLVVIVVTITCLGPYIYSFIRSSSHSTEKYSLYGLLIQVDESSAYYSSRTLLLHSSIIFSVR